jgi:hypothetical protein
VSTGIVNATRDLGMTGGDLTRACCAHENYLAWPSANRGTLAGSAEITNYFANARLRSKNRRILPSSRTSRLSMRDNLADILNASAPLTCDEFRNAVATVISEAHSERLTA